MRFFKVFDRLRAEKKFKHRLVAIAGDCSLPGLGLNEEEKELLISKVHIIFHCAATVRFDENLKTAFRINVSATQDILELAKQMKNLKVSQNKKKKKQKIKKKLFHSQFFTFLRPTLIVISIKSKNVFTTMPSTTTMLKKCWKKWTMKVHRK